MNPIVALGRQFRKGKTGRGTELHIRSRPQRPGQRRARLTIHFCVNRQPHCRRTNHSYLQKATYKAWYSTPNVADGSLSGQRSALIRVKTNRMVNRREDFVKQGATKMQDAGWKGAGIRRGRRECGRRGCGAADAWQSSGLQGRARRWTSSSTCPGRQSADSSPVALE
jgi:hypothetical protein